MGSRCAGGCEAHFKHVFVSIFRQHLRLCRIRRRLILRPGEIGLVPFASAPIGIPAIVSDQKLRSGRNENCVGAVSCDREILIEQDVTVVPAVSEVVYRQNAPRCFSRCSLPAVVNAVMIHHQPISWLAFVEHCACLQCVDIRRDTVTFEIWIKRS